MKKIIRIVVILFFGIALKGFSQSTAPTDFYAGKWEISIYDSPRGDIKFVTNLVRKDGKLTGELTEADDAKKEKRPITKVEESATKISIFFFSEQAGGDLSIDLEKVDNDKLKGSLMSYEATATRIKE